MDEQASVSDVKVKLCGVTFKLRATVESFAAIEEQLDLPYATVFSRLGKGTPRLRDATTIFAAFAQPAGKWDAAAIRAIMPFDKGEALKQCVEGIYKAINAALPQPTPDAESTEGAGGATADPQ